LPKLMRQRVLRSAGRRKLDNSLEMHPVAS
jgi:hypothetical protein